MSGTTPNFLDVLVNLNSHELQADSLIRQLHRAGRELALYGDDTWLKLFPGMFAREDGTTSFFVSVRMMLCSCAVSTMDCCGWSRGCGCPSPATVATLRVDVIRISECVCVCVWIIGYEGGG